MIKFICDIGSNHNQDAYRMVQLIDAAKEAGAWGVKFQLFRAEELYHESFPVDFEKLKKCELNPELMLAAMKYAKGIGLAVGVTYFHESDIVKYTTDDIDFLKISSFDWKRDSLIRKALIATKKRLIISTGVMTINDINHLQDKIKSWEEILVTPYKEIVFLHCVSRYPAQNGYFRFMREMLKRNIYSVGYSDHTASVTSITTAVELGAEYIEVHLDLDDRKGFENIGHCWTVNELKLAINAAKLADECMLDKDIMDDEFKLIADPSDGKRPLIQYRNEITE